MATTTSSPSPHDHHSTPPQLPLDPPPSLATSTVSRRLPPPCWSHDETVALIDAYRDKWYSLRRGNLRANHWQEVADDVAVRCPVSPPKTSVQCRHKMEKLRKRYRGEIQRSASFGGSRNRQYASTWVHFKRMDAMERGPAAAAAAEEDEEEDDGPEDFKPHSIKPIGEVYRNNINNSNNKFIVNNNRNTFQSPPMNNNGTGFRIRLPVRPTPGMAPAAKVYGKYDEFGVPNPTNSPNPGSNYCGSSRVSRDEFGVRGEMGGRVSRDEMKKTNPIGEMVEAIRVLGDGFVRMERMKMDMAREIEEMRMEMEMKRTEMILESQQRIVEAFAKAVCEQTNKKQKRMPTPEC